MCEMLLDVKRHVEMFSLLAFFEFRLLLVVFCFEKIQTGHFELIVAAVIWLKYCRYVVKLYPINQSRKKKRMFCYLLL